MTIEIKPHRYRERDSQYSADFYPFIDGEPAPELADCSHCRHNPPEGEDCEPSKSDSPLCYPFCGPICGLFETDHV